MAPIMDKGKVALSPYAKMWYGYNFNEAAFNAGRAANRGSKTSGGGATADVTISDFGLMAGTGIVLEKKSVLQHRFDVSVLLDFDILGADTKDAGAAAHTTLGVNPSYTVKYEADKLGLGAKFALPVEFGFGDQKDFVFAPTIATGLTYRAREKLTLNAGIDFAVVSVVSQTTETDLGNGITQTTTTWAAGGTAGSTNDGRVTISTGFKYAFNDKVNFDFAWNIVASIFGNDLRSDFDTAANNTNGSDVFWSNMNRFFTNIGFIIVVKL